MRHVALTLAVLGGCGDEPSLPPACEAPVHGTTITFREVARTRGAALLVTSPPNDIRRFVVEQQGRIMQLTETGLAPTPFLDVSDLIACCGEQGLLGLAFHPKYATNGQFFIFYTTDNANVVARYRVSATNPEVADPASATIMLSIPDFAGNHNGGMIEFGKDNLLYIGTGDGGGGGDPLHNGQNPDALLGKILRIDVDKPTAAKPYGIPSGNPFASAGGAPEVFIMGVRNPWRWSFDRANGDLYIGDVGQAEVEELTVIPAGQGAGANLGWNMYEGDRCFQQPCDLTGKTLPQFQKLHGESWCSVITGQTYRGACFPDIVGKHYLTDYCAHELVAATRAGTSVMTESPTVHYIDAMGIHDGMPATPTSLHADARGELYLTTEQIAGSQTTGAVYKLEAGM
ncbi:MAG TPA: PQQ-dependent sugar dehydrogenase [Kofleriaceae bacterium]